MILEESRCLIKLSMKLKLNHLGGYHHMGGTRIGYTEKDGVVDKNLKFFNINNLYISGSSVLNFIICKSNTYYNSTLFKIKGQNFKRFIVNYSFLGKI